MKKLIVALILMMTAATGARAQYIEEGDLEVQFSGSLFTVSGLTTINANTLLGYYVSQGLQIGGGPSLTYFDVAGFSRTTIGATLYGRYTFSTNTRLAPYVGAQWYQADFAPEAPLGFIDASYAQGGVGVKYFLNENVAYDIATNLGIGLGTSDLSFLTTVGVAAFF